MFPAFFCHLCAVYALAVQGAVVFAQVESNPASKFEPDVKSMIKLRLLLAFLGLIVLFIGTFLILWLIGRHFKRFYLQEPEPPGKSPFAEFGYKYQSRRKSRDSDDGRYTSDNGSAK